MSGRKALVLGLLILACTTLCLAASQNATVSGAVYDLAGKPLPGARVVLDNPALGFEREAITLDDGTYTITEVPPQDGYRLTAYRGTTRIDVRTALAVTVGEEKLILPPLQEKPAVAVGTPAPAATKAVSAASVSNERSTFQSGVITGDQLRSLPLFNRNFLVLGLITPNTHDVEGGSPLSGASFSIAGSRPNTNMFLLDGSDNVARSSNQAIPFQVNDSVQEFRVISSNGYAEYGGSSGGTVNVVTSRATNKLHGNIFGYFSTDALNADSPLSVYNGSGFDKAAAYAGTATKVTNFAPATYNSYAATAANAATGISFCTDSISAVQVAGSHACSGLNGAFGKNTLFSPAAILAANDSHSQPFQSRQFGGNMGGPLIKDKLFLFGSYESTLIDNPNPIFERVPTALDRTVNPLAGIAAAAAPHFSTASNSDWAMSQRILSLYPVSNVIGVPGVLEFFRGQAPNYTNVHNGLLKADFNQNSNAKWSFRYSAQSLNQLHDDTLPSQAVYHGNGAYRDAFNQSIALTNTHDFGRGVVMESRAGFTRFRVNENPQDGGFDATSYGLPTKQMMTVSLAGLDPTAAGANPNGLGAFGPWIDTFWLGIPKNGAGTLLFPAADNFSMFPTLAGLFPFARLGAPLSAPGQRRDSTYLLEDNLSWRAIGRHNFKFGGSFRRFDNRLSNGALARGIMVASDVGEFTRDSMGSVFARAFADPLAAFTTPSFDYAVRQPTAYLGRFNSFAVGGFLQDSWKISSRVTMNMGVRYDYFSTPTEANNNIWNYDPIANGLVQAGSNQVVDPFGHGCLSGKLVTDDAVYADFPTVFRWVCNPTGKGSLPGANKNDFAPRVGVAWDVYGDGATIFRAGGGVFYDQLPMGDISQLIFNRPSALNNASPQGLYGQNWLTDLCIQCGLGVTSVKPGVVAGPVAAVLAGTGIPTSLFQAASSPLPVYAIDSRNFKTPFTVQANASLQHTFNSKLMMELGYLHTSGHRLPVVNNSGYQNEWFCTISVPDANGNGCDGVNPVFTLSNLGKSTYHSLLARVRAAQFHGLTANLTYAWSRSFDNASNAVFSLLPVTLQNQVFGFQFNGLGAPLGSLGSGSGHSGTGQGNALSSAVPVPEPEGLTTTGAGQVFVSRYTVPQNPLNFLRDDYGRSDFDTKHRIVLDYVWDVPFMEHASSRRANFFGYWKLSGVVIGQSGQPFTVFSTVGGELTQRANVIAPVVTNLQNPAQYLSASSFSLPAIATGCNDFGKGATLFSGSTKGVPCTGNSARNAFVGPNFIQMNMAVQKGVHFGESRILNFRAEFFNLFNRANYYNPISALSVDGSTVNPNFGRIESAKEPFQLQVAARFSW